MPLHDGHLSFYQARTERRKSGVVTVQPTIDEDAEAKAEEVALVVGALLPQMKVKNEKGEDIEVSTLAAETGVVIFIAPKADTREFPGCSFEWRTLTKPLVTSRLQQASLPLP